MKTRAKAFDWRGWFERWEAMQNAHVAERQRRFALVFEVAGFGRNDALQILDLGCGPGSLSFAGLRHYPHARALGVDVNRVLLEIGRHMAEEEGWAAEFVEGDFRHVTWWAPHRAQFDLVVSATALHWLTQENLGAVYPQIFAALKPGGRLVISDHFASEHRQTQDWYRLEAEARQEAALNASGADSWDQFWEGIRTDLDKAGIAIPDTTLSVWEGTDDGYPIRFHRDTLGACGFLEIETHWQRLGDGILSARKPA